MPFHEKSAWVMGAVLLVGSIYYFAAVAQMSAALGMIAPPVLPLVIVYVIVIVILSITGHILIAISKPSEADDRMDERDRLVSARAGAVSGFLLGMGVLFALGVYLFTYDGNLMFHIAFGAMMVSQLAEYIARIAYYRTAV